jgi:hypothetical protein
MHRWLQHAPPELVHRDQKLLGSEHFSSDPPTTRRQKNTPAYVDLRHRHHWDDSSRCEQAKEATTVHAATC